MLSFNVETSNTIKARGTDVGGNATNLHQWLCENPLFEDEGRTTIFTPVGPWERGIIHLVVC